MSLRPLFISLESLMLQMLGQKLEGIPIVKIGIPLTLLPPPCPEPNFPSLQGNSPCSTRKSVSDATSSLLLHLVKGSHPMDVRPSGSPPRRNRLKSLVGCYHWFNVRELRGITFRCSWRRGTIVLSPCCNHKPTMGWLRNQQPK